MGLPKIIKTDNGPAYTGNKFIQFCIKFGIEHKTGIPYNPWDKELLNCALHSEKLAFE
jgi:transposase InsO family protein